LRETDLARAAFEAPLAATEARGGRP
jgi:hypothetical protein